MRVLKPKESGRGEAKSEGKLEVKSPKTTRSDSSWVERLSVGPEPPRRALVPPTHFHPIMAESSTAADHSASHITEGLSRHCLASLKCS